MDDDPRGLVADEINPQKSRVLLLLCLGKVMNRDAVQKAFFRY